MQSLIDARELRGLLSYDRESGEFRWRVPPKRGISAGALAGWRNDQGYWLIGIRGGIYRAHRLAWLYVHGTWPIGEIDHINMVRSDNRIANLRDAMISQNRANTGQRSHNTSGFKGVTWCKDTLRWRAQIRFDGKHIHIGRFDCPAKAHAAYLDKARALFGEFARAA